MVESGAADMRGGGDTRRAGARVVLTAAGAALY